MTTKRILVIDDEGDTLEIIQLCLETIGNWNVLTASSGREGVVQAEAMQPDVILLDLIMPRMDGLTTLSLLKENLATKHIPVILYTAASSLGKCLRWTEPELPVKAIIIKPFNLLTLPAKIATALAQPQGQ
ncbi:MAG: response regulator [Aphanothece sp. CMT-3BRIN-NPC111]|nr:response regulator [Aphanothece sp. CMT-3BRIN-NPC111]